MVEKNLSNPISQEVAQDAPQTQIFDDHDGKWRVVDDGKDCIRGYQEDNAGNYNIVYNECK